MTKKVLLAAALLLLGCQPVGPAPETRIQMAMDWAAGMNIKADGVTCNSGRQFYCDVRSGSEAYKLQCYNSCVLARVCR